MTLGKKPTVFISSTCYDLRQLRANLKEFFQDGLGYDVLLSEYDSFPLDPQLSAVENCLRVVDERADVFVLVIGQRYGWVDKSGRSVTNMEFLRAQAKQIPIYVFVDKQILSILPAWEKNPDMDVTGIADSSKLFEFIRTIRSEMNLWTFSFETAQDIAGTLKTQIGYLFNDCLSLRLRATPSILKPKVRELSGQAFRTALIRPFFWPYKLFAHVLGDGLAVLANRRRDFIYGITLDPPRQLNSLQEVLDYIPMQTSQILRASDALSVVFNKALPEAIEAAESIGDAEGVIYCAQKILEVYALIIDWSLSFRTLVVEADPECGDIINTFAQMCSVTLEDIERFSGACAEKILTIPDDPKDDELPEKVELALKLTPPDLSAFNRAVDSLRLKHGLSLEDN